MSPYIDWLGSPLIFPVRREYPPPPEPKYPRRIRRPPVEEHGVAKHTFRVVFRLVQLKIPGRWGLQWLEYHCTVTYLNGETSQTDLEAEKNSQEYPPLRFVRVKSYQE